MHYHQCTRRAFGCDAYSTGAHHCLAACSFPTVSLDMLPALKEYIWACDDALFACEVRYLLGISRMDISRRLGIPYTTVQSRELGRTRLTGDLKHRLWALVEDAMRAPPPEIKAPPGVCPTCDGTGVTHHPDFVTRPCHVCAKQYLTARSI